MKNYLSKNYFDATKQMFRKMKTTFLLFFLFMSSLFANNVSSQIKVTMALKNTSVIQVIRSIESQTDYLFVFDRNEIDMTRSVNVKAKNKLVTDVLTEVFRDTNVKYAVEGNNIVLISKQKAQQQQKRIISGKVTDSSGFPLPGVTVVIEGTTIGTITDVNGKYSLSKIQENATLVFSFVGMKAQKTLVSGKNTINIVMQEESIGIDEVVAIGYGTMKKSDLTGSVKRVSMEDKEMQASISVLDALSGSAAGVNIEGRGGAGSQPSFSIRGKTSLSASESPLIVLDGIIYNGSISSININDVASIDILKDASAAAVYGSRSANGVMIITTKKGKSDKPVLSFNANYGYQDMTNNPMSVMNADKYAVRLVDYYYQQDLYTWYRTNPTSDLGKPVRPDITNRETVSLRLRSQEEADNYLAGNEINWVDEVLHIAPTQNYNLSISGKATDKVNYYLSGSYTNEEGIQLNDKFKRFTFHSNIESEITDWLKLNVITSYSHLDYSGIPANLSDARVASPLADNHIGSKDFDKSLAQEVYMPYPLQYLEIDNKDITNQLNLTGSLKISIPWIKGLTEEVNYSHLLSDRDNSTFYPRTVNGGSAENGKAVKSPSKDKNWILNNIITYKKTFGDHKINSTLLFSKENRNGAYSTYSATQFENDLLGYDNMGLGTIYDISSSAWEENSLSYMGRFNYSYKSRYMLTGTVRKDGYSGFGKDNKWGTFPSVSLAWVASDEPIIKEIIGDTYIKTRLSYGLNGNQGIGRYASLARMGTDYYVYGNETAIATYASTLSNPSLSWEKTSSLNIGVDWGILNQRISGSVDVYKAKTKDVLVKRALPRSSGFNNVWSNIGGLQNKGVEVEIRSLNIDSRVRWETSFMFSLNRDKITKLYGNKDDMDIGNSWFVGEPISAIYDYEMAGGLWTEKELYNGETLKDWYPGQFKYVDQNNDGTIDPLDKKIIGYASPSYRFSISSALSYKNFTLTFVINSIQGGDKYYKADNSSVTNVNWVTDNIYRTNQSDVRSYWTPDNNVDNATGIYNNPAVRSGIYQSRSFVRLQDVSLSYSVSNNFLNTLNLKKCQFYISSKNPYIWTKWEGWDAESGISNTPVMRSIIAGIRLSL